LHSAKKQKDDILQQLAGVCFCQFNAPPLGRKQEAEKLTMQCRQRQQDFAKLLDDLEQCPNAETLDRAKNLLS
jgi:hypothetical protein